MTFCDAHGDLMQLRKDDHAAVVKHRKLVLDTQKCRFRLTLLVVVNHQPDLLCTYSASKVVRPAGNEVTLHYLPLPTLSQREASLHITPRLKTIMAIWQFHHFRFDIPWSNVGATTLCSIPAKEARRSPRCQVHLTDAAAGISIVHRLTIGSVHYSRGCDPTDRHGERRAARGGKHYAAYSSIEVMMTLFLCWRHKLL